MKSGIVFECTVNVNEIELETRCSILSLSLFLSFCLSVFFSLSRFLLFFCIFKLWPTIRIHNSHEELLLGVSYGASVIYGIVTILYGKITLISYDSAISSPSRFLRFLRVKFTQPCISWIFRIVSASFFSTIASVPRIFTPAILVFPYIFPISHGRIFFSEICQFQ